MAKRRTHSSIDSLPAALRDTITRMVTEGLWPADVHISSDGKPTYQDIVDYCRAHGEDISHSAVGRWAKSLLAFERMRSAAGIARKVMGDIADNATETQKAAAEIMTAQIIELIADNDLKPKDISMISGAIRDCTQVALKADQYIRTQVKERAAAADKAVTEIAKKKQIDPDTLKMIREQIFGIVD